MPMPVSVVQLRKHVLTAAGHAAEAWEAAVSACCKPAAAGDTWRPPMSVAIEPSHAMLASALLALP